MTNQKEAIQTEKGEYRFETISEIIQNNKFFDFVEINLKEFINERQNRPSPKQGYYYKRDWFDRMESDNKLKTKFFVENIENIWLKKSTLSSEYRLVIKVVCEKALQQTLDFYSSKEENKNNNKL